MLRAALVLPVAIALFASSAGNAQSNEGSTFPDAAFLEGRATGDPEAIILSNRGWQSFEHDKGFGPNVQDHYKYAFTQRSAFGFPVTSAFVVVSDLDPRTYTPSSGQKEVRVIYRVAAQWDTVVSAVLRSTGLTTCYRNSGLHRCDLSRRFTPSVSMQRPYETFIVVENLRNTAGEIQINVTYPATFQLRPLEPCKIDCF